jgi:hypothetical protein
MDVPADNEINTRAGAGVFGRAMAVAEVGFVFRARHMHRMMGHYHAQRFFFGSLQTLTYAGDLRRRDLPVLVS